MPLSAEDITDLVRQTQQHVWEDHWKCFVEPLDRVSLYKRVTAEDAAWNEPLRHQVLILQDEGRGKVYVWNKERNGWYRFA